MLDGAIWTPENTVYGWSPAPLTDSLEFVGRRKLERAGPQIEFFHPRWHPLRTQSAFVIR